MQTPSGRSSTATFLVAAIAIAFSFFFVANRTNHRASYRAGAQVKAEPAKNSAPVSASLKQDWLKAYGKLPLSFEANEGQHPQGVQFTSRGEGYNLTLRSQEADLTLRQPVTKQHSVSRRSQLLRARRLQGEEKLSVLRMRLDGSNPNATISGVDRTATKVNYFIGNDPQKWHTDVPAYGRVKYAGIYPGVDLVFYGNQRELEYDFSVAPGADAKSIALNIEGASEMRLDAGGNLILSVAGGEVELRKPNVYQDLNGVRQEVAGNYTIANQHQIRFALADYDSSQSLTIDPVVTYATYFGGSGNAGGGDSAFGIALDEAGDAYIAGSTSSADLVQVHGIDGIPASVTSGATSAFVAELNPTGTAALYVTYLGGSTAEGAFAVAVDATPNIYVTGFTESADFPLSTTNTPFQSSPPASINTNGAAFVTRLNPALVGGAQLVYSTYLGGSGNANGGDQGNGIAVDGNGDAFVVGVTLSADFPTLNAASPFSSTLQSSAGNGFVAEINTGASGAASLLFSTYLGGTGAGSGNFPFGDYGAGIALDSSSNAYVVGTTTSADFPTQGTAISSCSKNAVSAAFITEIGLATPTSPTLAYSTCLAGSTADVGNAIALGPNNLAYLTGGTNSTDFPVTTNTVPLGFPGAPPSGVPNLNSPVAYVSTVNTTSGTLTYSTLLGGSNGDVGFGIATDSQGVAYVAGQTSSANFPVTQGALQQTGKNQFGSAFVSKVNASAGGNGGADLLYSTYFGGTGDGGDPDAANAIAVSGTNAYVTGQATTGLATSPNPGAFQVATKNATGVNAFVADLPLVPTLSVTPPLLAFGTQLLNTPTTAMTATLTNNSSASLAIPFTVVGANGGDFVAASGAANGCTGTLAAGATCTIDVIFTPTLVPAGAESGTLQIANTAAPTQPFTVALTGTGSATGDFSISAPATFNLTSGMAGSIPVTIAGLQGFSGMVNLSCTGLSANVSSCTIPASANTGDTVNASVTATATFIMPPDAIKTPPTATIRQVVFLILGIATLFIIPMTQRRRMRLGMVAAMLVFVAVAGCSGSPSHPTSGSITISGTGTGATAGITHTATVALSISK